VLAGDFDNAIRTCRISLKLNPNDPKVHHGFALILLQKEGGADEAGIHFAKVLELDPGNKAALQGLHFVKTEQQYRKTLTLDPENADVSYRLGKMLTTRGLMEEAVRHFDKAIRLKPSFEKAVRDMGEMYMQKGKSYQITAIYRCLLKHKPNDISLLIDMAFVLSVSPNPKVRNGEEAVAFASKAARLSKFENPAVLDVLAVAYAETARFPEAIQTAQKAIQLARKSGKMDLAKSIEKSLELYKQNKPFQRDQ